MNTPAEALALSHIGYAEAQVVARFIDEKLRAAVDERTPTGLHGIAFQGQLLRTIAWLRSLAKLDDPGNDFQAITSAARSVFESAVDVTLMHFDGSANGPEKMDGWEDSAKLKHSQNATEYLAASGRAPTDAERTVMAYASREKDRVEKLRLRWWPNENGRHPRNRWTGRDLGTDAREADKLLPEGFEEFYRLRYPQLCWNVHGSGLAAVANVGPDAFAYIGGQAYEEAAQFATVVAKVVALHLGCWNEEDFKRLAQHVEETRVAVYLAHQAKRGA
ncbi:hypothetical protein A2cp1_2533 [Anaeromyxobacter dehalogenans 2CP-1]|uniref:Uncharacterized protein n=1 Tax=Anaeromyxobacter dehalogenans (strain ATCC BAA-258 / DSM 21875 / 2CP-1) TaxID=455488 RepID=B8JCD1_ANAD2|nr:hypothetical protein [Anaeromyxobacter dehalogenans]ACL65871.1 hypothetical protein A2cp1_2533 [Anaeromyxobacter dehalogenans 2CP-1]